MNTIKARRPPPGVPSRFDALDAAITASLARYGITVIRVGLGFIFLWFGDLFSLQKILGHTTLDMVRRYVNLDTDEVKRQHAQASPVDRLAIGPKVTVLLPWRVADRLEELAWRERTSIEALVKLGAEELVARSGDVASQRSATAA
jgi:hypothetical protein